MYRQQMQDGKGVQGNLPKAGIKHRSPTLQLDSLQSKPPGKHNKSIKTINFSIKKKKKCIQLIQVKFYKYAYIVLINITVYFIKFIFFLKT